MSLASMGPSLVALPSKVEGAVEEAEGVSRACESSLPFA